MALQLSKNTKARDVVAKFCKASSKVNLNNLTANENPLDSPQAQKGNKCPCGKNHFLYEIGGNIGKASML